MYSSIEENWFRIREQVVGSHENNSCAILALLTITKHINICDVTIKRFSFAFVFFFWQVEGQNFPSALSKYTSGIRQ